MGYISIQINKAKGSADTGASDHIERKTIPKKQTLHVHISTVNWWSSLMECPTVPKR